jgi:hypothetical protein
MVVEFSTVEGISAGRRVASVVAGGALVVAAGVSGLVIGDYLGEKLADKVFPDKASEEKCEAGSEVLG